MWDYTARADQGERPAGLNAPRVCTPCGRIGLLYYREVVFVNQFEFMRCMFYSCFIMRIKNSTAFPTASRRMRSSLPCSRPRSSRVMCMAEKR